MIAEGKHAGFLQPWTAESPGQQANASVKANFQMVRQRGPEKREMLQTVRLHQRLECRIKLRRAARRFHENAPSGHAITSA